MVKRYVPRKRDSNHSDIQSAFEKLGCRCVDLSNVGGGCPDILVCIAGTNVLVEIKSKRGRLTGDQPDFHERWPGPIALVRTIDDVVGIVTQYRKQP